MSFNCFNVHNGPINKSIRTHNAIRSYFGFEDDRVSFVSKSIDRYPFIVSFFYSKDADLRVKLMITMYSTHTA